VLASLKQVRRRVGAFIGGFETGLANRRPKVWQKLRERNEALDCRVYARAAAWIDGMTAGPKLRGAIWSNRSVDL
jgi:phage terminase large subunit GpA-like protein